MTGNGSGEHAWWRNAPEPRLHELVTMRSDQVRLCLPTDERYLRLVRLTATALADDAGFDFEDSDDLRLAVDELCVYLVAWAGKDRMLEVDFRMVHGGVAVHAAIDLGVDTPTKQLEMSQLSEMVLSAAADRCTVRAEGHQLVAELTKSRTADR